MIEDLITYALSVFGLTYIVGQSKISLPVREFLANTRNVLLVFLIDLVECPACASWWIGLIHGFFTQPGPLSALCQACMTTGSSLLLARLAGTMPAVYPTSIKLEISEND